MAVKNKTDHPGEADHDTLKAPARRVRRPLIALPPKVVRQPYRPAQPGIPEDRSVRAWLRSVAARHVAQEKVVPPLTKDELREQVERVRRQTGVAAGYRDFLMIVVNNEVWRETLARIPCDRRLLLLPKCLRDADHCRATIDEFGLICKRCGLCPIYDLTVEAEELGYTVLVAEGSVMVTKMIETGRIEGVVGVSCMNVLERCFPHMEAWAVPGMAVPLLQDGCASTTVDLDWVRDVMRLTCEDRTYRLNLDRMRRDVQGFFATESLRDLMGPARGETEKIARNWLVAAGKRWRPFLTSCVYRALQGESYEQQPPIPRDVKKLAVAVECFHKASLIHDDIEDGDEARYGQETVHIAHGMPVALNVGDFLLGEGYRLIGEIDVDPRTKVAMLRTAADGHLTLSRGQGAELCWARKPAALTSLEVLDILRQKTAPAFEVALRLGAFYGGADTDVHDVLKRYSESLGIAYQIRDDLEDFAGEGDSDDLRKPRPSLILAITHKRAAKGAETNLIASLWNRTRDYEDVAHEVQRIMERRGVVDKTKDLLEAYTEQATRSLRALTSPTLKGLLRRVVGRIFAEDRIEGYCGEFEARHAAGGQVGAEPAA